MDDNWFIVENPVVNEARFGDAFTQASWPDALEGTGNYRPLALSSYAIEWALWGESPFGYHLVSVLANAAVALLAFLVLRGLFSSPAAAGVGAIFFAIHPVHVEAVANVMGRSELYAALGYLGAVLVYERWKPTGPARGVRLLAILLLYVVALLGKEIAVTLPAMLIVLEVYREHGDDWRQRLWRESPTFVAAFAVLGCYVLIRAGVLGALTGESAAAGLASLETGPRLLTAVSVWPHYLRLLFFPLDLSADYSPAVLLPTATVGPGVLAGLFVLIALVLGAIVGRTRAPALGLACAWFLVAISPVSNLVVRSDILLAERTLFLPSFAAAIGVAWIATHLLDGSEQAHLRRRAFAGLVVVGLLLAARTVTRNPTWSDTFTVLATLNEDHPESWMAVRFRATGLARVGELDLARQAWDATVEVAPDHYQVLVEAAAFHEGLGHRDRSERLLDDAIALLPSHPVAYRRVAEYRIRRGDGRGAHAAAVAGLRAARGDRELWALLSETYVMKADLEAAVRARRASLGQEETEAGWIRLAELYEALQRPEDASRARRAAQRLNRG